MPIDRATFEQASEDELAALSTTDLTLGVLAVNADQAFTAHEIARRVDLVEGAVRPVLTRLTDRGLVEHKGPYWAITTDADRLGAHEDYARSTALYNDLLGPEDIAEWDAHAPDEPHPSVREDSA